MINSKDITRLLIGIKLWEHLTGRRATPDEMDEIAAAVAALGVPEEACDVGHTRQDVEAPREASRPEPSASHESGEAAPRHVCQWSGRTNDVRRCRNCGTYVSRECQFNEWCTCFFCED